MIIERSGTTPEGYVYMIIVKEDTGHRNGYIGVFEDSPFYKLDYSDNEKFGFSLEGRIDVHGGLTYSGLLGRYVVGADNPWFIGFDCNHLGDKVISPSEMNDILLHHNFTAGDTNRIMQRYNTVYKMMTNIYESDATVKTTEYVYNECMSVSKQLKEIEDNIHGND